jgi:glycosyltransferase involved in cell wall biosynthesis
MLAADGWELTVAAPNASRSRLRRIWPYACHTIDTPANPRLRDLRLMSVLLKARLQKYDLLYVHSQSAAFALWPALIGSRRVVYHNADYLDPLRYPLYCFLEKRVARLASLCINNEFHRGYIARAQYGIRCPMMTVPPNLPLVWPVAARNPALRAQMTGGDPGAFVLILHGGYSSLRMTDELLQCLARMPQRFRLAMASAPPTADCLKRIESLGLAGRVFQLPIVDYSGMLEYTVNADAGVLLYNNNDLGNFFTAPGRLTEYLACSIPVLASDHTAIENLVLKYRLGVTVHAPDPESISAGILRLQESISAGLLSGGHCRAEFVQRFAVDHWGPAVRSAFDDAWKGKRRNAEPPAWQWLPNAAVDHQRGAGFDSCS